LKHATNSSLDKLETLLGQLHQQTSLKEKKRGIFYRKSVAWLHFHEDPAGLFADLRSGQDSWERFPVNTAAEYASLLEILDKHI
jgi:hypothetical protein